MEMRDENSQSWSSLIRGRETQLGHVDIVSPGEVGSEMGPRQPTELFQGLDDDLLGIRGEWLSSYMKVGMEGKRRFLMGFISRLGGSTLDHPRVSGFAKLKATRGT